MVAIPLQIELLLNTCFSKQVMATLHSLFESQALQKSA